MLGKLTLLQKLILLNGIQGGSSILETVTGTLPLALQDAISRAIVSLTRYGKVEQRNLPQGFTELEYLQTDGNSYIDTGIAVPTNYKWELTLNSRGTNTSPYWGYSNTNAYSSATSFYSLGANGNSGISGIALSVGVFSGTPETTQSAFYNADDITSAGTLGGDAPHTIRCEGSFVFTADGTSMTQVVSKTFTDFTPTGNAYLFARNTPSISKAGNGARIHAYKVWNASGVLVQNLVPAKNSSNVLGMYDRVSGQFLTNAGTGSFTAGPAATPTPKRSMDLRTNNGVIKGRHQSGLPLGYTLLDYARSGGDAYIDLGYKGNGTTKVEVKYKYYAASTVAGSGRVFGSRISSQSDGIAIGTATGTVASTATNKAFWNYDSQPYYVADEGFGPNVWKTIVFSAKEHTIDGVSVGDDYEIVEFETPQNLKLFAFDNNGTVGVGYVDVEYCKLWKNGVMVRNVVLVENPSGVVGGYDLASGEFLPNQGTGTFTAGAVADDPIEIYTDGTPEVLTVTGKNLLGSTPIKTGYYIDANGVEQSATGDPGQYHIRQAVVAPSTTYTVSLKRTDTTYNNRFHAYDRNGNWIAQVAIVDGTVGIGNVASQAFTTPANAYYIRQGGRDQEDYQLELGSTATAYEPYTAQTASVPTLLAVGDYKDTAEIIGGLQTHKVGIKVLTGDEDIGKSGTYLGSFFIRNVVSNWGTFNSAPLLCTRLVSVTSDSNYAVWKCMVLNNALNLWLWDDNTHQIADAQNELASAYASGNPYIVIYPLATETTEQTTAQPLVTYEGTNVVDSTANVSPVEMKAEYYKKSRSHAHRAEKQTKGEKNMKKSLMRILMLVLTIALVLALVACERPTEIQVQNPDGTQTVAGVLIEQVVTTVARLLEALVLAYGAWTLDKFGENKKLQNLNLANQELCRIVKQTVRELNQTIVNELKAESPDGKLTGEQIQELNEHLLGLVKMKMDEASIAMIKAAGADLDALIIGHGEAYLDKLKTQP